MMAGLLSLVQELLPMILPGSVEITRAADIRPGSPLTDEGGEGEGGEEGNARREEEEGREGREGKEKEVDGGEGASGDKGEGSQTSKGEQLQDLPGRPHNKATEKDGSKERREGEGPATASPPTASTHRRHTGVSMRDAMVHKTDRMCAVVLTVKPLCSTVVFHNAEQECIVYAVAGTAVLATLSEDHDAHDDSDSTVPPPPPTRHVLGPGDFVFIPAWTEHQVANESPDTDVVWVVVRTGPEPTVVPLSEWGGPEATF